MKSKRSEEHIGQNFDLKTYTVEVNIANEAADLAEQDARYRAIEAYCHDCNETNTDCCPLIVFNNPCKKLTKFLKTCDK